MQNRKKLTASFRRSFLKGADNRERSLFARWFIQLDLSGGQIFRDQLEEQEIEKKMEQNLRDHFFHQTTRKKIFHLPSWLPAATAAVLIIIAGILWLIPNHKTDRRVIFAESFTGIGERKIISLSDGSKITLNNASHIKFPQVFSDSLREVFLEGEAFFEIAHNERKPFVVRAGKLNIQVLGTSFNVRHYKSDRLIDVVVATGKVGVHAGNTKKTWMLTPGNQLAYDPLTGKVEERMVAVADFTGWQKGELVFKNEKLEDIFKRLERWYDVKITIKTLSLKNKRISLKQKNESLQTVLKMLGMAGGFKYQIKEKTVLVW
ncbi:MAG TPA: FecR domain-containing protein [Pedobacter sp.]|uniref:FecR family protein n=1 Tax=Pedobacter sp. TaxID=1411316 RepID=UPI002D0AD6AB|nr:FecR domain-containing protein [Pedobacter sp.]HMI03482.1 FecR domain-containing protein [Pedobacter sp.]